MSGLNHITIKDISLSFETALNLSEDDPVSISLTECSENDKPLYVILESDLDGFGHFIASGIMTKFIVDHSIYYTIVIGTDVGINPIFILQKSRINNSWQMRVAV